MYLEKKEKVNYENKIRRPDKKNFREPLRMVQEKWQRYIMVWQI